MMVGTSRYFAGALLLVAGIYQLTPMENACLVQCRAPLRFIQNHGGFRPGIGGSLRLGMLHGVYCIGCCWALMALLFVGGVMNVLWIAAIAIVAFSIYDIMGRNAYSLFMQMSVITVCAIVEVAALIALRLRRVA